MVIAIGRSSARSARWPTTSSGKLKEPGCGRVPSKARPQGDWVLIDAGDIIVHLFRPEVRAASTTWKDVAAEPAEAAGAGAPPDARPRPLGRRRAMPVAGWPEAMRCDHRSSRSAGCAAGPLSGRSADDYRRAPAPGRSSPARGRGTAAARRRRAKRREAELIEAPCPTGAVLVALDERGRRLSTAPTSPRRLGRWRDDGSARRLAFVIGGADGLDAAVPQRADADALAGRHDLAAPAGPRHAAGAALPRPVRSWPAIPITGLLNRQQLRQDSTRGATVLSVVYRRP